MKREVSIEPLTPAAFRPYGDVLEASGAPSMTINRGMCDRYHDLADLDFAQGGRAGISIFKGKHYTLPLRLEMLERHPLGSQAFLPTTPEPFLVIVAADDDGRPAEPKAFMTFPGQGVNYHRGTWHGVLTPLVAAQFFVVDWVGTGNNLEEHWFDEPFIVR